MRRSVIIAQFWWPEVARIGTFSRHFRVFWKTTPYDKIFTILFGKFTSRHRSTLLCAKFVKIVSQEIGESVRYLPDQKTNIFFGSLSNCGYCADRAEICHGQPPTFGWQLSKFHPSRFTFGWLIAGHVKTIQNAPWSRIRLFPISRRSIASRRVKDCNFL